MASVALVYAASLIWQVRQGEDEVPWASAAQLPSVRRLAWSAVVMLVATGIADAFAAIAVMRGQKSWIGVSVAGAMATVTAGLLAMRVWTGKAAERLPDAGNLATFAAVENLMCEDRIYRDADLTLGRIVRELHLPAKAISRSVNTGAGVNVSHYFNGFRVSAACDRLRTADQAVTAILFDVGFNTKSNFNREFVRIVGVAPSVYRRKVQVRDA